MNGPTHKSTLEAKQLQAEILMEEGDLKEAGKLAAFVVEASETLFGDYDSLTIQARKTKAEIWRKVRAQKGIHGTNRKSELR